MYRRMHRREEPYGMTKIRIYSTDNKRRRMKLIGRNEKESG